MNQDIFYLVVTMCICGLIPANIAYNKGYNFLLWWLFGTVFFIVVFPMSIFIKKDKETLEKRNLLKSDLTKEKIEVVVDKVKGYKIWFKENKIHREDGPAVEYDDGSKIWLVNGVIHREDGPAVEFISGTKIWYKDGERHRLDGPAVEHFSGLKEWYEDGKFIMSSHGHKKFYQLH